MLAASHELKGMTAMAFLSRKVWEYRHEKLRAMMRQHKLDAVAVTTPDFFQFATNYHVDVQTWERPIVAVLPLEGAPFAVMNELSTNHLRFAGERGTMWVEDVTLYAEHPMHDNRTRYTHQYPELVAETLQAHGLAKARIGVDAASGLL